MYILEFLNSKNENFTSLRYNTLKNMMVGEAVIKDALAHWEPLGFLDGIDDVEKKEEIAVAFDNITKDILSENERILGIRSKYNFNCMPPEEYERNYLFEFDTMVYPLIRRVINGNINGKTGTNNFDYDKFIDILDKYTFLAINYDFIKKEDIGKFDVEAEFICILAGIIEDIFNKK